MIIATGAFADIVDLDDRTVAKLYRRYQYTARKVIAS
jgi:hypothetical protein